MNRKIATILIVTAFVTGASMVPPSESLAAENLTVRKGISFVEDKDNGFPIIGDKMNDTTVEAGKPTLLFFGASADLNTARQAKRLVSLYNKMSKKGVKFIIINVDKPANTSARNLIKKHYKGYIPCQVVLDKSGKSTWSKVGEIGEKEVYKELQKQLKP